MNLTVHQSITIHQLRVDSVANSSVLQIGSAGSIRPVSQLYNSGGFDKPAEALTAAEESSNALNFVPLPNPS
ncbi:spore germination protein GerPB [Paenibacillus pasadenensis]|uniref:Protein GerPB, required for proper assembly of spore coat, mutations lead to super-dormant spore n=1 Tax=Paenibacillus pasadenensis TaxID=217090 RepID=A0A2N5N593_9BACL|nr:MULTISPECIES: spore germination protein GerPB [Paenibacillus]PLT45517.1 Protein GerPB, required for proper assembly of spore coat, mutations lead to super-dormant spore [Paenibacillus pasadenensis]QGG55985.1 spore gernimation protein [Paenibacillus sp. B01]